MVCSVCKGQGHNKRTCIARKLDDSGLSGEARDRAVQYLTDEIQDEALCTLIETGAEIMIPGVGFVVRLGRAAWSHRKN